MSTLSGSARATLKSLMAEIESLKAQIAEQQPAKGKAKQPALGSFRTKAQRAAGKGFACSASPACSRRDLRTAVSAGSHEQSTEHGWHIAR